MTAQVLNTINVLTTRRNLAVRRIAALADSSGEIARLRTFVNGADARMRALGAQLVAMPGRPGAVIADVFLSMVADD